VRSSARSVEDTFKRRSASSRRRRSLAASVSALWASV